MSKKAVTSVGRRDFFRKAGLGVGALGVASAGLSAKTTKAEVTGGAGKSAGYRVTAHVRKYYELAKF